MADVKVNPFFELVKEENFSKINVDSRLKENLKLVFYRIGLFFENNGLLDCKDYDSFLKKYLLDDSDTKFSFVIKRELEKESYAGVYHKRNNEIDVTDYNNINSLCHEVVHFLVTHDSNGFSAKVSDSRFFNEGLTEYLASCIMGCDNNSAYFHEYDMAKFYCTLVKNSFRAFLNDRFAFSDNEYAPINLMHAGNRFDNSNKKDDLEYIQKELMDNAVKDLNVDTFEEYDRVISAINQRPCYDIKYAKIIFERVTDKYLSNLKLDSEQYMNLKSKLLEFCRLSNNYRLYGDNSVAVFDIEDLHIAFDPKFEHYGDFPSGGDKENGTITVDYYGKIIIICHRDKKYKIDMNKANFRQYDRYYTNAYEYLSREIELQQSQVAENYGSQGSTR